MDVHDLQYLSREWGQLLTSSVGQPIDVYDERNLLENGLSVSQYVLSIARDLIITCLYLSLDNFILIGVHRLRYTWILADNMLLTQY